MIKEGEKTEHLCFVLGGFVYLFFSFFKDFISLEDMITGQKDLGGKDLPCIFTLHINGCNNRGCAASGTELHPSLHVRGRSQMLLLSQAH